MDTMNIESFDRAMVFFGYQPGDQKHTALRLMLVDGLSQADASRITGYSQSQLSTVCKRVRTGLQRVKDLTGVDLCA